MRTHAHTAMLACDEGMPGQAEARVGGFIVCCVGSAAGFGRWDGLALKQAASLEAVPAGPPWLIWSALHRPAQAARCCARPHHHNSLPCLARAGLQGGAEMGLEGL
jgi:hypothetical protein